MPVACPNCGTLNPDRTVTCQYCGAALSRPADPFRARRRDTPPLGIPWRQTTVVGRIYPAAYPRQVKDPSTGLLIELLPGLFGFLGIGYLWAGETAIGLALLLGFWCFWGVVAVLTVLTFGLLLCFLPFFLLLYCAAPFVSAILLQRRLRARQVLAAAGSLRYPIPY